MGRSPSTASPNADKQWALRNGKLNGRKLTFEVVTEDGGVLVFDLTFDGESIQGSCAGTGHGDGYSHQKENRAHSHAFGALWWLVWPC